MADEFVYPKEIEEAARMAEELHKQMFPDKEEIDEGAGESEPVVVEEKEDQPEQQQETFTKEDIAELLKFKERYAHLKGKYDAEVPRLASELKELRQQVTERKTTTVPEIEIDPVEDLLSQWKDEYTEDYVNQLQAIIRAEAAKEAKKLIQPVAEQAASTEDQQIKIARQNFMTYLDGKSDGWRSLWNEEVGFNANPDFAEFLEQDDPSGLYKYGDLVNAYTEKWDADKLATVFNLFLKQKEVVNTETPPPQVIHNREKDALIAPKRTQTNSAPVNTDKKIWTMNEIEDFKRRDRLGEFEDEVSQAMWNDILSAMSEKRIR
jgi:hypothetical protein